MLYIFIAMKSKKIETLFNCHFQSIHSIHVKISLLSVLLYEATFSKTDENLFTKRMFTQRTNVTKLLQTRE